MQRMRGSRMSESLCVTVGVWLHMNGLKEDCVDIACVSVGVVSVTWRTFYFDILSSTHFASLIALNGNIRSLKQKLRQITSNSNHWILTEILHIDVLYACIIVYKICVCVSLCVRAYEYKIQSLLLLLKIVFLVSYYSNIFPPFSHPCLLIIKNSLKFRTV